MNFKSSTVGRLSLGTVTDMGTLMVSISIIIEINVLHLVTSSDYYSFWP